jgi:tetratricopeptide (TPR) repeat protein
VATIYYNRGVDLLADEDFAGALSANAKALRLDPTNRTARGNLLATLNNWAISLGRAGRYADAVDLLRQGMALDAGYETFALNLAHVHHQWAEDLCRRGRFQEALDLLDRAADEFPEVRYFARGPFDVYRRWATALLEAGRTDRAFDLLADARRAHGPWDALLEAEAAAVNDAALALLEAGRVEDAVGLLDRGLAELPDSALLRANRRAAVMRWAEPAFKTRDYAEAIRRTTRGAAPGQLDKALLGNVRYGYYHWMSDLLAAGRRREAERVRRRALEDPFLEGEAASAIPPWSAP